MPGEVAKEKKGNIATRGFGLANIAVRQSQQCGKFFVSECGASICCAALDSALLRSAAFRFASMRWVSLSWILFL
jgi:hypothetical protein